MHEAIYCSRYVPVQMCADFHNEVAGSIKLSCDDEGATPVSKQLTANHLPAEADLKSLATRADAIKAQLTGQFTDPIVIVEFSGSPKSGKTTNIDIIEHFFKRSGLKVWAPAEGASKRTPYNLRKDLVAFNTWSLNYAISELLLSFYNVDRPNLVILDRGPFDSLAWMRVLRQRGKLEDTEYEMIRNFALHPKWAKLIDRTYLFTCSPEKSIEREIAHKLTEQSGIAMNPELLGEILSQYTLLGDGLDGAPNVTSVDTTNTDGDTGPRKTAYALTCDLLGCFEEKLRQAGSSQ